MDNKYITILDFEVGRIFQYKVNELDVPIGLTIHQWYEEFITNKGHNLNNIEWMAHDIKEFVNTTIQSVIKKDK